MEIKKFLKPNKKKIIVFAVLFAIFGLLPIIPVLWEDECALGPCPPIPSFEALFAILLNLDWVTLQLISFLVIFAELITSYIFACLIVWKWEK